MKSGDILVDDVRSKLEMIPTVAEAATTLWIATMLPAATTNALYEVALGTNTPATVRYEVTAGALPEGLQLNPDTGGITGRPTQNGKAKFTITAHQTNGLSAARADYAITVTG